MALVTCEKRFNMINELWLYSKFILYAGRKRHKDYIFMILLKYLISQLILFLQKCGILFRFELRVIAMAWWLPYTTYLRTEKM